MNLHSREKKLYKKTKRYFHSNRKFVGSRGLISQIPPNTSLQVDGTTLVPCCSLKNLGIYFDTHMTFDTHLSKIWGKIFSTIIFINRIKDNFNKSARITVIETLVLNIVNYGIKI